MEEAYTPYDHPECFLALKSLRLFHSQGNIVNVLESTYDQNCIVLRSYSRYTIKCDSSSLPVLSITGNCRDIYLYPTEMSMYIFIYLYEKAVKNYLLYKNE